ncbi:molybdenum cofactor biosynthesis protein MoaE [Paracoccus pacificus]|uniref:Molybdopterin synthase catalytic subunit n=1 Tax=Paracoccus pacificus TaxID=1463598 RepID=A0ABW4R8I2_9RHOB
MSVLVTGAPFDPAAELAAFGAPGGAGAVVSFSGVVRAEAGRVASLRIEHYPGMTETAITAFGDEAAARFSLSAWRVVHRHGQLAAGDPIMMVITAAPHRVDAFRAAEYLMDWLKSRAPFWKCEIGPDGEARWVDATAEDETALSRW